MATAKDEASEADGHRFKSGVPWVTKMYTRYTPTHEARTGIAGTDLPDPRDLAQAYGYPEW